MVKGTNGVCEFEGMAQPKTGSSNHGKNGPARKPSCCTRRADHLFGGDRVMRDRFSSVSFRGFPWFNCFFQAQGFAASPSAMAILCSGSRIVAACAAAAGEFDCFT
jgi:hypothetical protein